jgi:hypothetical protein
MTIDLVKAIKEKKISYYKDANSLVADHSDLNLKGYPYFFRLIGKNETRDFTNPTERRDREMELCVVIYYDTKSDLTLEIIND